MGQVTVPPAVEGMLEWWLRQVREVLDDQLLSVVLYGSVTLGDFQPGWSDVDVCVVLREPIAKDTGEQLYSDTAGNDFVRRHGVLYRRRYNQEVATW